MNNILHIYVCTLLFSAVFVDFLCKEFFSGIRLCTSIEGFVFIAEGSDDHPSRSIARSS